MSFKSIPVCVVILVFVCTLSNARDEKPGCQCYEEEDSVSASTDVNQEKEEDLVQMNPVFNEEDEQQMIKYWKRAKQGKPGLANPFMLRALFSYPKRVFDDDSHLKGKQHWHHTRGKNIVNVAYPNERKMLPRLY